MTERLTWECLLHREISQECDDDLIKLKWVSIYLGRVKGGKGDGFVKLQK